MMLTLLLVRDSQNLQRGLFFLFVQIGLPEFLAGFNRSLVLTVGDVNLGDLMERPAVPSIIVFVGQRLENRHGFIHLASPSVRQG